MTDPQLGEQRDARRRGEPPSGRAEPPAPRVGGSDAELWARCRSGDRAARDALVLFHAPLVTWAASRRASARRFVPLEDLVGWGMIGLLESVDRYDHERGVDFVSFAVRRIRGAITDGLRVVDWRSRRGRDCQYEAAAVFGELAQELGTVPTVADMAARLGVTTQQYAERYRAASPQLVGADVDLDEFCRGADTDVDDGEADPALPTCRSAARRTLRDLLHELPPRHRQAIVLYYFEGLTLASIGEIMGVCESRVSVLCRDALSILRRLVQLDDLRDAIA